MTTITNLLRAFASAARAAAAVEAHQSPKPADLRRLGIDHTTFGRINAA